MSLGIGLGAFMQGMGQGINLGRSIVQMRDEAAAREAAQGAYRQSSKEREVAIGNRMAGDGAPEEGAAPAPMGITPPAGSTPPPGGTAPVAAVQQQALPPIGGEGNADVQGALAGLRRQVAARDPAVERVASDLENNGMPLETAPAPRPTVARGDAPVAVTEGINARRALDPNSPTYAQDIARINDRVVGQTMGGARTPTPPPAERPAAPASAPAAMAGLPPLPAASRGPVSRDQAEREVGSVFDFYMQRGAPRVVEQMLASGNVDGARQFQTWIRGEQVQRGMRDWSGAIRAAQTGDADGFLRYARRAYNNEGYSADGQSLTASRVLRDDQGGVTGMELTVRGRDGTESVQRFNGSTDLYRQAISFLSPEQQFQHYAQELTAARTATTQLAIQDRTDRRTQATEARAENRTIRAEGRGEDRTVRTEGRAAAENDRRSSRAFADALERDSNASLLRQAEAAARARGERPEDVRRNLEAIRNNLARAAMPGAFDQLSANEQIARAVDVYRRQRTAAEAIGQPARPGAPTGGQGITVWRPQ